MKFDETERRLLEYRAQREQAWSLLHDDIAGLRGDLEQRGIGGRVADKVGEQAHDVWDQTVDVASSHRGIVAATLVALVAWLLRKPIARGVGSMFGRKHDVEPEDGPSVEDD